MKDELQTTTIKAALQFPEGTPIQRMTGKLTHIFPRKEGEGDFGPYTSQSGVVEDDGSKMLFTIWNRPAIPEDYKGRTLIFRCGGGKKPTMTLKSDFKDSTKRTLNVTKSCLVLTEEEESDDIPMDYSKEPEAIAYSVPPKPQQTAPKPATAPKKAIPEDGVDQVKHRVMQLANLRKTCDDAAAYLYPNVEDISFIKEIGTSIFIQAVRENLHDKLPNNKPISKSKPVQAEVEPEEPF